MMSRRILLLCLLFLAGSAYLATATDTEPIHVRKPLAGFPMQIGGWTGRDAPFGDRVVDLLGVDDHLSRSYALKSALVGVYVGFYQSQREGKTIHSPLNCLPGAGWNPLSRDSLRIPIDDGTNSGTRTIEVNRLTIQKGPSRQVVLYWYQSHGRIVANEYLGKAYTFLDAIRLNRTDAAMIRVISPIATSGNQPEQVAERAAVEFVQSAFPLLSRYLPE
jgi:EpsI family protein